MAVWSVVKSSFVINSSRIDGEYFKPKYLDILNKLNKYEPLSNYVTEFIHPGEFKRIYSKQGISVLRAQNVRPLKIDINENDELFLKEEIANKLTKNFLQFGDILITRTGANYGQTALFTNEREQVIVTSHTFIVRVRDINSAYLALFLNTDLGIKQIEQGMYGSSQPEIAPKFLKRILVPRFEYDIEEQISKDVLKAYELRQQSQTLYKEAEELLEKELGLDGLEFEKPKSYTAKLSEVYSHNRCDADFYQTKFRQIAEHINTLETLPLRKIAIIQKGFEVGTNAYVDSGKLFIRVSNFTKNGFSQGGSDKYISDMTYAKHIANKPNMGDILLTKDGTVGVCYVVDSDIEGIISSGIVKLLTLNETIPKEYLSLAINSKLCQMQIQRDCSGALIVHWKPEDIRNLKIPILSDETMNSLANMATQSKQALKQSKQLLEDAKTKVEALIEEATR